MGFSWFSHQNPIHQNPMGFSSKSHQNPMGFSSKSHQNPIVSHPFPIKIPSKSHGFLIIFPSKSHQIPCVSHHKIPKKYGAMFSPILWVSQLLLLQAPHFAQLPQLPRGENRRHRTAPGVHLLRKHSNWWISESDHIKIYVNGLV